MGMWENQDGWDGIGNADGQERAGSILKIWQEKRWMKKAGNSPPSMGSEGKELGREAAMGKMGWIGKNS